MAGCLAVRTARLARVAHLPVAEQLLNVVAQALPIEVYGDGEDRAARPIVSRVKLAHVIDRRGAQRLLFAVARAAPRVWIAAAAQLDHELVARLIVDRAQLLQARVAASVQLVRRKMRPA